MKERIKYIDVAKGICMLIVLVDHAVGQYGKNGFAGEIGLNMFKLPLFFFVSGMFFSQKIILKDFIKRKFKRLVVPFCVFYITTVIILPYVIDKYANYTLGSYWGGGIFMIC